MKKFAVILISVLVFPSCSIFNSDPPKKSITGQWKWIQSTDGWSGHVVLSDTTGFSQQLNYTVDGLFSHYRADTLVKSGKYYVEESEESFILRYETEGNGLVPDHEVEFITADEIKLIDLCTDCGTSIYKRIFYQ